MSQATRILTAEAKNGPLVTRYVLTVRGTADQRYSVHVIDPLTGRLKWGRHFWDYRSAHDHLWTIPDVTNVCDISGARVFREYWND